MQTNYVICGDSVFNYAIDDVSGFILEDWQDYNYILNLIENTNMNYIEIFASYSYTF